MYRPREDASAEGELNALASVYAFCLRKRQEKQKGSAATAPNDAMKGLEHDRATTIIPDQT